MKKKLSNSVEGKTKLTGDSASKQVAFKLDSYHHSMLEERTKRGEFPGSPNLQARSMLLDALAGAGQNPELYEEISRLRVEISQLRHDVALSTEALLVLAGKTTEPEAKKWVQKNLGPK